MVQEWEIFRDTWLMTRPKWTAQAVFTSIFHVSSHGPHGHHLTTAALVVHGIVEKGAGGQRGQDWESSDMWAEIRLTPKPPLAGLVSHPLTHPPLPNPSPVFVVLLFIHQSPTKAKVSRKNQARGARVLLLPVVMICAPWLKRFVPNDGWTKVKLKRPRRSASDKIICEVLSHLGAGWWRYPKLGGFAE